MSFEQQQLVLLHQWSWCWTSQSHASEEAHQSNHAPHAFSIPCRHFLLMFTAISACQRH